MKILIGIVISIIVSISILTVVLSMSEEILYDYNEIVAVENFEAVRYIHQVEILELEYDVYDIISLNVNGVNLIPVDTYIVSIDDNIVILLASASDINDDIILEYSHLV